MGKDSAIPLRARILKVFDRLLYQQGYEQTTLRQLADECGIGRGHLYFYFAKKENFPIALRRDLYKKIDLILADIPELAGQDGLLSYFVTVLAIRHLIAKKAELYRAHAEYASHTEVLDGMAELQNDRLESALRGLGLSVSAGVIAESLLSATYAEYALIKCRFQRSAPPVDHVFLFRYYLSILFSQMDFLSATVAATQDRAIQIFDAHAMTILRLIYEMDGYDYALYPEESSLIG